MVYFYPLGLQAGFVLLRRWNLALRPSAGSDGLHALRIGIACICGKFMERPPAPGVIRAMVANAREERPVNGLIYLIGVIVVILFILSFLGLR